jgi:hypothetical protein
MTLDKMIETLQIVAKYVDDPSAEWCSAEHDILYLPLDNDDEISEEDAKRLDELGAHKSSDVDCWAIFT